MAVGGGVSSLGIGDLHDVKTELKEFNTSDWRKFGSVAGLRYNTLNIIQENKTKVEDRFEECLACWLRREDKVDSKGKPSWRRLADILEELGDKALADKIRSRKGEQQLDRKISVHCNLRREYYRMSTEYGAIVERFVNLEYMDQHYTQEDSGSGEGYACLMFYEKNSFIYFTAIPVKMLTALHEYIKDHHRFADIGPIHYFHFKWFNGFIELNFNEKPSTGWTIIPLIKPCRLYQEDIDSFDGTDGSIPPYCFISFEGSPDAVPTLHYSVPLVGVADPVTLFIHRTLKCTAPPVAPYTGLVYHEKKEDQHLIIFTAARLKDISTTVTCIEDQYPLARINQLIHFDFDSNHDYIELILDAPQDQSITGWTIEPQSTKFLKDQFDRFSFTKDFLPSCLVSFHASPDAVPILHYSVPLEGVAEPKTIDLLLKSPMTSSQVSYVGLIYYEWKGKEYLMTFTASKKLNHLLQYIEEYHPLAEIGQVYNFSFSPSSGFIELLFDDSCKGWTVQPLVEPCRLYQDDIDRFDEATYPFPPSCLVSVYGSPDAVPKLHYSVPLEGVADPVTLWIVRKLQLEKDELEVISSHKATFEKDYEKLKATVADKEAEIEEEKKQVEEEKRHLEKQYLIEKQITKELKTKVTDNELYIAKLLKEREQLQERVTSLEEQSMKETSSKEVQFNYMIPLMDNLDFLSDVQVAEKKLLVFQGKKPQLMNWEKYGLRIGVSGDSLLSFKAADAAVVALVGGQFQFPPNTILVSAVYAVSLSKPLLKPLQLEIQHCIDLTRQPDLAQYLKFAIAPVSTLSLPYQFSIVEGGEFSSNGSYGFIKFQHEEPCLVCILGTASAGISDRMIYKMMMHYEQEGVEDLVTLVAAKDLNALIEYIERRHPQTEIGQHVPFSFDPSSDFIEFILDAPQIYSLTGWTIQAHIKPCRMYRHDIDKFGEKEYPLPPSCLVSVYGSPNAFPTLHYSVPLEGVADPVRLFIHRTLRTTDPITRSSSSSNVVHESTSVSSTGGASPSATVDVNKVKKVIDDVLVSHYAALNSLPKKSLTGLVNQLYTAKLISNKVREDPSMEGCITEFKAVLSFKRKLPQVEEYCQKFLSSFIAVGGPYADAATVFHEDWIEAIRNELGFDFNINIDA
uniref:Death domain-containing protein n=1 Tax=Amphimedon queenslandica TaxID=400682 RepID=A0A1X7TSD7_AMPQE